MEKSNKKKSQDIFDFLSKKIKIKDGKRRGEKYNLTHSYHIRIIPVKNSTDTLFDNCKSILLSNDAKKFGISDVCIHNKSVHSSKFKSISCSFQNTVFDIVPAAGLNNGEKFEDTILTKMNDYVFSSKLDDNIKEAFNKIKLVAPVFNVNTIKSISKRIGSTKRSETKLFKDTGKIIADLIISDNNNNNYYISLKNNYGTNIAQFGIGNVFNNNLEIDTNNHKWKKWMEPLNLDPNKITYGLKAYKTDTKIPFETNINTSKKISKDGDTYSLLKLMWGSGYIYLKENKTGWEAINITEEYLSKYLLSNLIMTKILYPNNTRKSTEVHLSNEYASYKIKIRNKINPNIVRPNIIQLEKVR